MSSIARPGSVSPQATTMRQLSRVESIAFFVVPGLAVFASFQWLYGPLLAGGVPAAWATFGCLWSPVLLMSATVLGLWLRSRRPFGSYFLAEGLGWRAVLLCVGAFIGVQLLELALGPSRGWLMGLPGMSVPTPFPELFHPDFSPEVPLEEFLGMRLPGNPGALLFWALWLVPNILGEELLWRGYALPRMQRAWGRYAWVVNGLLWNLGFHFFMRWSCLVLLPISLLLPYLVWRTRSWGAGVVLHGLGNVLLFAILIPSVLA